MLMRTIKWSNGDVRSFDERNQQIAALSGPAEQVAARVLREADPDTKFFHGDFRFGTTQQVKREEW